jgi:transcriptional regulator with XRE-family HTH domain
VTGQRETFGQMIYRHRKARPGRVQANRFAEAGNHLSLNALARMAGVNAAHLSRIELGEANASRDVLLAISDALGLSPDDRDRLLFAAGYAPCRDFQAIVEHMLARFAASRAHLEATA